LASGLRTETGPAHLQTEFRGPGMHHRFDDSPDDYDMDLDQRTRMFGGRAGRAILLGEDSDLLDSLSQEDDNDVDMEFRGDAEEDALEEKDLEQQVRKEPAVKSNGAGEQSHSNSIETAAPALAQTGAHTHPATDNADSNALAADAEAK